MVLATILFLYTAACVSNAAETWVQSSFSCIVQKATVLWDLHHQASVCYFFFLFSSFL